MNIQNLPIVDEASGNEDDAAGNLCRQGCMEIVHVDFMKINTLKCCTFHSKRYTKQEHIVIFRYERAS